MVLDLTEVVATCNYPERTPVPFRDKEIEDNSDSVYVKVTSEEEYYGSKDTKECTSDPSLA